MKASSDRHGDVKTERANARGCCPRALLLYALQDCKRLNIL